MSKDSRLLCALVFRLCLSSVCPLPDCLGTECFCATKLACLLRRRCVLLLLLATRRLQRWVCYCSGQGSLHISVRSPVGFSQCTGMPTPLHICANLHGRGMQVCQWLQSGPRIADIPPTSRKAGERERGRGGN